MARHLSRVGSAEPGEAAAALQHLQSAGLAACVRARAPGAALLRLTAAAAALLSAPAASAENPAPASPSPRERRMRDLENRLLDIYRHQATPGGFFNMNNKIAMRTLGLDNPDILYLARRLVDTAASPPPPAGCPTAGCLWHKLLLPSAGPGGRWPPLFITGRGTACRQ